MADIQTILHYTIDLDAGASTQIMREALMHGDKDAHRLIITAKRGNAPVDLTGVIATAYMVRADGATVTVQGMVTGDHAEVVLSEDCYAVIGRCSLVVRLTSGDTRNGILRLEGAVGRTRTDMIVDNERIIPSLEDLLAKIAEVDAAGKAANSAASAANTAAANADDKAQAADTAASSANSAASAANTAAANADDKAQAANTAASSATQAASAANTAAANANDKAQEINTASDNANTAASTANSAAAAASAAAQAATTAETAANTAASNANSKADAANAAAQAANTSASTANAAAEKINGLTVSATGLAAGSAPTAAVSEADGRKQIAFGIPKGDKGDTGATPNITIGTVTTGTPGTQASANLTGTAEDPVLNLTIPQGAPGLGSGTVTSVNDVEPDVAGNVTLTAEDVGAAPDKYQIDLTTDALTAMTLAQRAQMYADGTRMIRTTNGATVVLLTLSADGKVQWAGGKIPPNLLDNSDFRNPVNQRGETSYTTSGYTIDRWRTWSAGTVEVGSGYVQKASGVALYQYIEQARINTDSIYTVALKTERGLYVYSGTFVQGFGSWGNTTWASLTEDNTPYFRIEENMGENLLWAALYEGEYTADTLPPYTPKGYAAALSGCQMYYRRSMAAVTIGTQYGGEQSIITFTLPQMRVKPTITVSEILSQGWGDVLPSELETGWSSSYGSMYYQNYLVNNAAHVGKVAVVCFEASADL